MGNPALGPTHIRWLNLQQNSSFCPSELCQEFYLLADWNSISPSASELFALIWAMSWYYQSFGFDHLGSWVVCCPATTMAWTNPWRRRIGRSGSISCVGRKPRIGMLQFCFLWSSFHLRMLSFRVAESRDIAMWAPSTWVQIEENICQPTPRRVLKAISHCRYCLIGCKICPMLSSSGGCEFVWHHQLIYNHRSHE